MRFIHDTLPQRVVFATGDVARAVAEEVSRLGARRVMLIASSRAGETVASIAAGLPVALRHDEVVMHVPVEVAQRARAAATAHDIDAVVSVGGGSATGLAKAVALTGGVPIVAVPTTYAGSEATNVWGLTSKGAKTTGVDDRVLPRAIVYDAALLGGLPRELAVASGLNAVAHCVDAMWGPRVDPIDQALAIEGLRALGVGLVALSSGAPLSSGGALPSGDPASSGGPGAVDGVEQTLYGSYLAAVAFASAGSGLHHKICHVLGGMFDLPHAQTHAVVLPHVLALNGPAAPAAARRIADALGASTANEGLALLRDRLAAPRALRDYGMPEDGITRAVAPILAAAPAGNPVPVTSENITTLLRRAWAGEQPR